MLLRIGDTIDRYRIEALIGQGGMAAVYRVRHVQLDSEHALKVLFITAPKVIRGLLREGRVQANLRHPNIIAVTDVLDVQGAPALVMEYIDGPALDTWLLENHPTLEESLWLFRGILRGMTVAHERGVVHRDLKPANVLLAPTEDGLVPKVSDFGLVKSLFEQKGDTQAGMSLGTPEYMSPEQIRDASAIDYRADMWALGCILYELVCHRRAFQGVDKMSTFNLIVAGTYTAPDSLVPNLPRNVGEAIQRLLEVDRDNRLARCEALYDLLYEQSEHQVGRIAAPTKPILPLKVEPPSMDSVAPLQMPTPLQLSVPTDAPAAPRAAVPPGAHPSTSSRSASRRGASLDTERPPLAPRRRRATPRSVAVLGGLFGLSVLTAGMLFVANHGVGAQAQAGPPLARALAPSTPIAAPIVVGFPPPGWETDDADDVELARVEDPPPAPAPRPRPQPVAPPVAVADPAPTLDLLPHHYGTSVTVVGDAVTVWLLSGDRRIDPRRPVAAGAYDVMAEFPDAAGAIRAGEVVVDEAPVTLSCNQASRTCRSM